MSISGLIPRESSRNDIFIFPRTDFAAQTLWLFLPARARQQSCLQIFGINFMATEGSIRFCLFAWVFLNDNFSKYLMFSWKKNRTSSMFSSLKTSIWNESGMILDSQDFLKLIYLFYFCAFWILQVRYHSWKNLLIFIYLFGKHVYDFMVCSTSKKDVKVRSQLSLRDRGLCLTMV